MILVYLTVYDMNLYDFDLDLSAIVEYKHIWPERRLKASEFMEIKDKRVT